MSDVVIRALPFDDERAQFVVNEAKAELDRRYGGTSDGAALTPAEFTPPAGCFLVASDADGLVGCVGIRQVAPGAGEIKRLWVHARGRQRGIATALMASIENEARNLGFTTLVLETGWAQPEAVAFYEKTGWRRVEQLPVPIDGHPDAYRFTKP